MNESKNPHAVELGRLGEKRRQPPEEMEQWADALNARGLLEAGEHTMLIDW
jgi:hypothetical protein